MTDPQDVYRRTTPGSRALHERAVRAMPGGTTRTTTYFDPYPLYIDRGEGCRTWDVDGAERIDMLGNYTALILGHAHPKVVEAVQRQVARGTAFAAANPVSATRGRRRPCSRCGWRGPSPAGPRSPASRVGTTAPTTTPR
ncbi:MAG: aminotransferase class III-fold pyridoxal phosphate-dependent enzyme [Chloroflexi bacterium]|nr:MAG: aminotransferase class III-fold pyridoxal phosphate-dependent enzyme [Chloroflexota bacterium]